LFFEIHYSCTTYFQLPSYIKLYLKTSIDVNYFIAYLINNLFSIKKYMENKI